METLATADGQAIDLDAADELFAKAMSAPAAHDEQAPAPPKREPADPEAPYGRKVDGTPKRAPGGRPPKPRMIEAPKGPESGSKGSKGGKDSTPPPDYTQALMEFTEAVSTVLVAVPIPHDPTRVRVRVQAKVIAANQVGIAQSVNAMAQHNATVRVGVEKLTTGNAGWVLPAVMALAPFAVQTAAIWRAPIEGDMRDLADQAEAEWQETLEKLKGQFTGEQETPDAGSSEHPA